MKSLLALSQILVWIRSGLFICVVLQLSYFHGCHAKGLREITCGSVFKLLNTAFKVRLHSHDVKYGSGSGQQSVTGTDLKEDVNSNWQVKGTPTNPCIRG